MDMTTDRPSFLACPDCRSALVPEGSTVACSGCGSAFPAGPGGFLDFGATAGGAAETSERLEAYAEHQEGSAERRVRDFLSPYARSVGARRLLDAGCGVGSVPAALTEAGLDAYGVDLPKAAPFWERAGRDPGRFFVADATRLPFADGSFDLVLSMGVIEHIGTLTGHCTLAPDFRARRQAYARELTRVASGRLLVSCPNKLFPVDLHHGPGDAATPPGRVRGGISRRLGVNVHRTWGDYHLLSLREVRDLFLAAGARQVSPLPAAGFFSFDGVRGGRLAGVAGPARAWVERMPPAARGSFLDPFVLAEVLV